MNASGFTPFPEAFFFYAAYTGLYRRVSGEGCLYTNVEFKANTGKRQGGYGQIIGCLIKKSG
jgi:hypothetical protein